MLSVERELTRDGVEKLRDFGRKVCDTLYWDTYYTTGYSSTAGVGNGIANAENGESFSDGFGEAYCNNFPAGMVANLAYPIVFCQLKKTKHFRLYVNLFTLGVNGAFLAYHTLAGTDNPIATMTPNTAVGLVMANRYASESKNLEEKIG